MRRLSPTLIALILFIVLDTMAFYAAYVTRNAESKPITLSASAPEVTWKDFGGASHRLKDLEGHVVVLHFWAAWCLPCRDEFPKLLKAAADNPDVMFLTITSDDNLDPPTKFIKTVTAVSGVKAGGNVLFAWDPARTITYDQFLTARYPESVFLDPTGHLRRKYPVAVDWDGKDVRDYIKELKGTR